MATHKIVSREEWLHARKEHLQNEKAFTRARDELSRARRELPWTAVDKPYLFAGPDGEETLADLFDGRSQLLIYHFMFGQDWEQGCKSCSFLADSYNGAVVHLAQRDVTMVTVSIAALEKLMKFRQRMGWTFKWVSSEKCDFNRDFNVSFTAQEQSDGSGWYNYQQTGFPMEEAPGISAFIKQGGKVYHTYSSYGRGLDMLISAYHLLDLVPKGRDEAALDYSMQWIITTATMIRRSEMGYTESRNATWHAGGSDGVGAAAGPQLIDSSDSGRTPATMNFELPADLAAYLQELDEFIEREIKPLEQQDDNIRFFDHRREDARTDWERGGLPSEDWEALLAEAVRRADAAGHYRYPAPKAYGGRDGTNLGMAVIREHFAAKGLGLHNDLQNEHSIVGNNISLLLMLHYGSDDQKAEWIDTLANGTRGFAFGITEPQHGSDATHMETTAVRDGDEWVINGEKTWNTGIHKASHDLIFARTSGKAGDGEGITAFLVPAAADGFKVEEMLWTFNMPTDHGRISLTDVRVGADTILGGEGRGLQVVQHFFNENRIRQAAASLGAAQFCINESVEYAKIRAPFGKPLAANQAIQFPLVELQTQCEMIRALIHKTAWQMDTYGAFSVSDKVSMCNYWSNRLCCDAADRAMQVHGGLGYSRHKPFEHIYRHHRRYRITEGAEEIQMRRVAGYMFGFMKQRSPKGVAE